MSARTVEEMWRQMAAEFRGHTWALVEFRPRAGLWHRLSKRMEPFVGQPYDPSTCEVIQDAWDHEHCAFCGQTVTSTSQTNAIAAAYQHDKDWLCPDCHNRIVVNGEDPARVIEPFKFDAERP